MAEKIECTSSPSGNHAYDLNKYSRDDQGFWINCVHCGSVHFFAADTEGELYEMFGLYDDDE